VKVNRCGGLESRGSFRNRSQESGVRSQSPSLFELWRAKGENSGGRKKKEDRIQKRKGRERDTLLLQEEKGKRKGHSFAAGENG